jgi:hypothetical protein
MDMFDLHWTILQYNDWEKQLHTVLCVIDKEKNLYDSSLHIITILNIIQF